MAPYPLIPVRQTPRDTALIADVLETLSGRLHAANESSDTSRADLAATDEVQELISAAMSEMHRVSSPAFQRAGIAPVLGSGVLQSLMRQRHTASAVPSVQAGDSVDERR